MSRRVRDLAIKAGAGAGAGRPGLGFASYSTGRSGLGSLRALQVGLVSRSGGSTIPAHQALETVLEVAARSRGGSKIWRQ